MITQPVAEKPYHFSETQYIIAQHSTKPHVVCAELVQNTQCSTDDDVYFINYFRIPTYFPKLLNFVTIIDDDAHSSTHMPPTS